MSALAEKLTVRDARATDLDAVAALELISFPVPWKREYFASEVGAGHRFNRVVRGSDGRLAGYVFCAFAGGEVHVHKIAVAPLLRRQGIARLLMNEVLAFSARISAEEIYLEVRPTNVAARNFYSGLGFREVGRRAAYYADGEDALVMSLFLRGPVSAP
jgi:[ribosomal protein S18]-alanine N-acetyltransferase